MQIRTILRYSALFGGSYVATRVLLEHTALGSHAPALWPLIRVAGTSMEPTLRSGATLLRVPGRWKTPNFAFSKHTSADVARSAAHWRALRPADIVVARDPRDADALVVKRIAAVAGQCVPTETDSAVAPRVCVDDAQLGRPPAFVPAGFVWLRGDNPRSSRDSRRYGAVPCAHVQSRVLCCVWPPAQWAWLAR